MKLPPPDGFFRLLSALLPLACVRNIGFVPLENNNFFHPSLSVNVRQKVKPTLL